MILEAGKLYRFEAVSTHMLYRDRKCTDPIGGVPTKGIVVYLQTHIGLGSFINSQVVKVIYEDMVGYLWLVIAEKQLPAFFTEAVE